jgi:hypothetical protein
MDVDEFLAPWVCVPSRDDEREITSLYGIPLVMLIV